MLVVAIDTKKVAVDIEYIHPRNESLLQNVRIPDSQYSPRENFYLQWCAKECLVKYLDLTNTETSDVNGVLDGKIDMFIQSCLEKRIN